MKITINKNFLMFKQKIKKKKPCKPSDHSWLVKYIYYADTHSCKLLGIWCEKCGIKEPNPKVKKMTAKERKALIKANSEYLWRVI